MGRQVSSSSDLDDEHKVCDFEIIDKPSYNEWQNALGELHVECLIISRTCSNKKKIIFSLESKANDTKVELDKVKNSTCKKFKANWFGKYAN